MSAEELKEEILSQNLTGPFDGPWVESNVGAQSGFNLKGYKPVADGFEPKEGDIVLVEMIAYYAENENDLWHNEEGHYFRPSCVVAVKDKPLKAGDKVYSRNHESNGIVIGIWKDYAWLKLAGRITPTDELIENLERVE